MQVSAKGPLLQVVQRFEFEIEKIAGSRFIAIVVPATAPEEVVEVQRELRAAHPHCRHVCFAYVGSAPTATRHSDDGEPAKTAGLPMLRVLLGASLRDTGALVVRYFGGVKLGTGGLVRAYTQAVREALERAPVQPIAPTTCRALRIGYSEEPKFRHWCAKCGVALEVVEFGASDVAVVLRGVQTSIDEVLLRAASRTSEA